MLHILPKVLIINQMLHHVDYQEQNVEESEFQHVAIYHSFIHSYVCWKVVTVVIKKEQFKVVFYADLQKWSGLGLTPK